jgi:hypothetical protein
MREGNPVKPIPFCQLSLSWDSVKSVSALIDAPLPDERIDSAEAPPLLVLF